jgi:hypothetical protein
MRCALSRCLLKTSKSEDYPEGRPVRPPSDDFLRATTSEGWVSP